MAVKKQKTKEVKVNARSSDKKDRMCYFCVQNISDVSSRDTVTLRRFISSFMKIAPRRRTGLCAAHQRKVARSIKVARELSLLPYVAE